MKELMVASPQPVVVPAHMYLVPPTGFHAPPSSWMNRQQSPVRLEPTCCGEVIPLAVQLSVFFSASMRVCRLRLPPRAAAFSTNSRAADQEKTPKKLGSAPGLTCCSQFMYSDISLLLEASSN